MMNEMVWYRFVEAGGFAKASRKLEVMVGAVDADALYWAFQRALTYTDYLTEDILADAVAKRAASAIKRQQKEEVSLAKDLSGGMLFGALA